MYDRWENTNAYTIHIKSYYHTSVPITTSFESEHQINIVFLGNLSNTAAIWVQYIRGLKLLIAEAALLFSIALPLTTTYIHMYSYIHTYGRTYIHTDMLASVLLGTTAFRMFPMSMGLTWLPDGNTWWTCVHVDGHLRGISTFPLQSADHHGCMAEMKRRLTKREGY